MNSLFTKIIWQGIIVKEANSHSALLMIWQFLNLYRWQAMFFFNILDLNIIKCAYSKIPLICISKWRELWTDVVQDFRASLAGCVDSILRWVTCHSLKIFGFQKEYRSALRKWDFYEGLSIWCIIMHHFIKSQVDSSLTAISAVKMCKRGYTHFSSRTRINSPGKLPLAWMWIALCQYKVINME